MHSYHSLHVWLQRFGKDAEVNNLFWLSDIINNIRTGIVLGFFEWYGIGVAWGLTGRANAHPGHTLAPPLCSVKDVTFPGY